MSDVEAEGVAPAEYPKALYKDGSAYDPETGHHVAHQHLRVVASAEEEAEARDEGWAAFTHEPLPEAEPSEEPAQPGDADHAALAADAGPGEVDPLAEPEPHPEALDAVSAPLDPASI